MLLPWLLTVLLPAQTVLAVDATPVQRCFEACQIALSYIYFQGSNPLDYYGDQCTTPLRITSMYACAYKYCTDREIQEGLKWADATCLEAGEPPVPPWQSQAVKFTPAFINNLTVMDYADTLVPVIQNTTVMISEDYHYQSLMTDIIWYKEEYSHKRYGWAMYGFWGGVILIGMCNKFFGFLFGRSRQGAASDQEQLTNHSRLERLRIWTRARFTTPATFGHRHQQAVFDLFWGYHLPTRWEFVVISIYTGLNVILCAVNYQGFTGNVYWPKTSAQIWRYFSDRTGILSFANLPWLWLFSSRNNIFQWLTDWDYATFNLFHRVVARIATVEAILHSIGYTAFTFVDESAASYRASWKERYWYTGAIATITMSLLLFFSATYLRRHVYDLFILIHIAFALITLVCLFYHVDIFDGEYNPYLWPLVALWVFDRAARLARLVYLNFHAWSAGSGMKVSSTKAVYEEASDIMRLEITPASKIVPNPGQHYFIYMPISWKGWENHPFTMATWSYPESSCSSLEHDSSAASSRSVSGSPINKVDADDKIIPTTNASPISHTSPADTDRKGNPTLTFLIRPPRNAKSSFTARLRKLLTTAPDPEAATTSDGLTRFTPKSPRLLIEGPYGHAAPLNRFSSLVLIAGGSGITASLPYIQQFVLASQDKDNRSAGQTIHVTLIWSARHAGFIRSVLDKELKDAVTHPQITMHLYCTSELSSKTPTAQNVVGKAKEIEDDGVKETVFDIKAIEAGHLPPSIAPRTSKDAERNEEMDIGVRYGRPDLKTLIPDVIFGTSGVGRHDVAVMCCGPASMADTARQTTTGVMTEVLKASGDAKKVKDVQYFEERFGW